VRSVPHTAERVHEMIDDGIKAYDANCPALIADFLARDDTSDSAFEVL
jgi:hypothetical protein